MCLYVHIQKTNKTLTKIKKKIIIIILQYILWLVVEKNSLTTNQPHETIYRNEVSKKTTII